MAGRRTAWRVLQSDEVGSLGEILGYLSMDLQVDDYDFLPGSGAVGDASSTVPGVVRSRAIVAGRRLNLTPGAQAAGKVEDHAARRRHLLAQFICRDSLRRTNRTYPRPIRKHGA